MRCRLGIELGPSTALRAFSLEWLAMSERSMQASRMAGRQGVSPGILRNPNKDRPVSLKPYDASDLAPSDSFVGFRPLASLFGFAGAMTLEMSLATNISEVFSRTNLR